MLIFAILLLRFLTEKIIKYIINVKYLIIYNFGGGKLGKFNKIFNYARTNNIKALNQSIKDIGYKHHVNYMTNMMFVDDINKNYQLLCKVENVINILYSTINENCLLKKKIGNTFEYQYKNGLLNHSNLNFLTEKELSKMIYRQALEYYFKIDIKDDSNYSSFYEEAIQYRIVSNFLQNDIELIILKIYENTEIIIEDTKNLNFLIQLYRKTNKNNNTYNFILELLTESIQNIILQNDKFNEEYFNIVKKINYIIQANF